MNIERLLGLAKKTKEVEVGKMKFVLKQLNGDEEIEAEKASTWAQNDDIFGRLKAIERESLPYAIVSVNGAAQTLEQNKNLLKNCPPGIRRDLELEYRRFLMDMDTEIENLKNE